MNLNKRDYNEVLKYIERGRDLLHESVRFREEGRAEKFSESLWGSLVSVLNAYALVKGARLTSHKEVRDFVRQLSSELQDNRLYETFRRAEALHANFYHGFMDINDIVLDLEEIENAVVKIIGLVEKELRMLER